MGLAVVTDRTFSVVSPPLGKACTFPIRQGDPLPDAVTLPPTRRPALTQQEGSAGHLGAWFDLGYQYAGISESLSIRSRNETERFTENEVCAGLVLQVQSPPLVKSLSDTSVVARSSL